MQKMLYFGNTFNKLSEALYMSNPNKSSKGKEILRTALSQALGLDLADDIAANLLDGNDLIEQLSKHHTLAEIGTALIRLDALAEKHQENCECFVTFLGKKYCYSCLQVPPDED